MPVVADPGHLQPTGLSYHPFPGPVPSAPCSLPPAWLLPLELWLLLLLPQPVRAPSAHYVSPRKSHTVENVEWGQVWVMGREGTWGNRENESNYLKESHDIFIYIMCFYICISYIETQYYFLLVLTRYTEYVHTSKKINTPDLLSGVFIFPD